MKPIKNKLPEKNSEIDTSESIDLIKNKETKKQTTKFKLTNLIPETKKSAQIKEQWEKSIKQTTERLDAISKELDDISKDLSKIIEQLDRLKDLNGKHSENFKNMKQAIDKANNFHENVKSNYAFAIGKMNSASKLAEKYPKEKIDGAPKELNEKIKNIFININKASQNLMSLGFTEPKLKKAGGNKLTPPEEDNHALGDDVYSDNHYSNSTKPVDSDLEENTSTSSENIPVYKNETGVNNNSKTKQEIEMKKQEKKEAEKKDFEKKVEAVKEKKKSEAAEASKKKEEVNHSVNKKITELRKKMNKAIADKNIEQAYGVLKSLENLFYDNLQNLLDVDDEKDFKSRDILKEIASLIADEFKSMRRVLNENKFEEPKKVISDMTSHVKLFNENFS